MVGAASVDQTVRVVDPPIVGSEVEIGSVRQSGHDRCLLVARVCPSVHVQVESRISMDPRYGWPDPKWSRAIWHHPGWVVTTSLEAYGQADLSCQIVISRS